MAKESTKEATEKVAEKEPSIASTDPALNTPTMADLMPCPGRYEIRSPNPGFKGVRGEINVEDEKSKKMVKHPGVQIANGVGWTDDHLVANECLRFGFKVIDHKHEGK